MYHGLPCREEYMNNEEQYEPEIDVKDLFFYILYRWRSIMIVAILLCVLVGTYKTVRNAGLTRNTISKKQQDYELDLARYELDKSTYERKISDDNERLEQQRIYMEKSVLMRLDPYNKPIAGADIFVRLDDAEWEGLPDNLGIDPTDSLLKMYTSNFSASLDWDAIEELTGNDSLYLEEILHVGADYNSNMITVRIVYSDGETAQKILDVIINQILARQDELSAGLGRHTLTVSNRSLTYAIDHSLAESQKANIDAISNYESSIIDRRRELAELEENEPQKPFELGHIKYPVAGFLMGGFLMVLFYGAAYLFGGRLHGEQSLRDRYGYRLIGVLPRQRRQSLLSCVDHLLDRHSSVSRSYEPEEAYERIAIRIGSLGGDGVRKVLVTGTVPVDALNRFTQAVSRQLGGVTLEAAPDMNKDLETLKRLAGYDGVLLLEEEGRSQVTRIEQEHDSIRAAGRPVIGYVLL